MNATLHAFECSFTLRRKVRTWIRFAPTREEALRSFRDALAIEHPSAVVVAVVPRTVAP